MQLILASSSIYRKKQLESLRLDFSCISPNIDETPKSSETPQQLCQRLALAKAKEIGHKHSDALIIGSDQVAYCGNKQLTKPGGFDKAFEQLSQCAGKPITFYTGIALYNSKINTHQLSCEQYRVDFRPLSNQEITNYLTTEQPYNCAGAFMVEGLGISLFERLEGEDYNSLIGLPLIRLLAFLKNEGISPLL
ncbi:7-methyl-GTP pyrophosphatase [Sinobacterium norvegicum]|uniref:7-methyl-GTP pyrophosphatase n=1 Tax=Sinobacterium norvegicum TaxID=1641715 RepID=A0ABN8ECM4_9GAMM|nr:nucleoside triphosphate pyrophosphatase [Sinobacterium norvegicum]CAH0990118.1 7-methyl-GTP pyrophosphatase [Sinobacterium norvegicum]